MRVSDEEDGRETPLLERPPSEHAIERLKIFAVGSLGVALILAGLLTYRVLGIAECRARSLRWRDPYHVLITGFEPFANFSDNPTQHVARLLDKSCAAGVCFHAHVLSVDERGMARAEALLGEGPGVGAEGTWDAAIHLGYEDSARGLKLETIAKNIGAGSHAVRPMAGEPYKETPCDGARPVAPGETCLLPTTAPLNLLNLPILAEGARAARRAHRLAPPPQPTTRLPCAPRLGPAGRHRVRVRGDLVARCGQLLLQRAVLPLAAHRALVAGDGAHARGLRAHAAAVRQPVGGRGRELCGRAERGAAAARAARRGGATTMTPQLERE